MVYYNPDPYLGSISSPMYPKQPGALFSFIAQPTYQETFETSTRSNSPSTQWDELSFRGVSKFPETSGENTNHPHWTNW